MLLGMDIIERLTSERDRHDLMQLHPAAKQQEQWYHRGARDALDSVLLMMRRGYEQSLLSSVLDPPPDGGPG